MHPACGRIPIAPSIALVIALALPAACADGPAVVPRPAAVPPVAPGSTEPLRFADFGMGAMRRGTEIGRYVWDVDCGPPYNHEYWTTGRSLHQGATWTERFAEVMADNGFTVAGGPAHFYDADRDERRARVAVYAELKEVRLRLCRWTDWLFGWDKGIRGDGTVKVDWAVYAPEEERLLYRLTTTGSATLEQAVPQGNLLLIEEAFSNAAAVLAADAGFRAALSRGGAVARPPFRDAAQPVPDPFPAPVPSPAPRDPFQPVALPGRPPPLPPLPPLPGDPPAAPVPAALPAAARADHAATAPMATPMAAVVRVGGGLGVAVARAAGHSVILTLNAAVGGDATVRVTAPDGTVRNGAVIRRDGRGGLALVRLRATLPVAAPRQRPGVVSEPVFAPTAEGGIATGILGGVAPDRLEADLAGGEVMAGAPLFDRDGAVLGLAAPPPVAGSPTGLSVFVPAAGAPPPPDVDGNLDGRGVPPT